MRTQEIINQLFTLKEDEGLTFKHWQLKNYNSGYQVVRDDSYLTPNMLSIEIQCDDIARFINSCKDSVGLYRSFWVATKQLAVKIGIENNQESIIEWSTKNCIRLR